MPYLTAINIYVIEMTYFFKITDNFEGYLEDSIIIKLTVLSLNLDKQIERK